MLRASPASNKTVNLIDNSLATVVQNTTTVGSIRNSSTLSNGIPQLFVLLGGLGPLGAVVGSRELIARPTKPVVPRLGFLGATLGSPRATPQFSQGGLLRASRGSRHGRLGSGPQPTGEDQDDSTSWYHNRRKVVLREMQVYQQSVCCRHDDCRDRPDLMVVGEPCLRVSKCSLLLRRFLFDFSSI